MLGTRCGLLGTGYWVLGTGWASDEDPFLFDEMASTDAIGQPRNDTPLFVNMEF